jgi:hypothetical protein
MHYAKKPFSQIHKVWGKLYFIRERTTLLFCNVLLNFRKISILVWIDLELKCKRYKRFKKSEKNKKKEEKKGKEKWTEQPSPAQPARPTQTSRTGTPPLFLPLTYRWTPRVRFIPNLQTASPTISRTDPPTPHTLPHIPEHQRHSTSTPSYSPPPSLFFPSSDFTKT